MSINRSDLIDANSNLRGRDRRILPGRDQVLKMYRLMMTIRRFEEPPRRCFCRPACGGRCISTSVRKPQE